MRSLIHYTLLILLVHFGLSGAVHAQPARGGNETINIDLLIRGTHPNVDESKRQALEAGEKRAFYKVLVKEAPKQARDIYRKLRGTDLTQFVESFTIVDEAMRSGSYEANVVFRFNKRKLYHVIGDDLGVNPAENVPQGDGLLVIPPYESEENGLLLFERGNFWRAILNNVALEVGQGLLVMPFGDPQDLSIMNHQILFSGDKFALAEMARRYGTRNVVIAFARSRTVDGKPVVEVVLRKAGANKEDEVVFQYNSQLTGETVDILLTRAAHDVSKQLRESIDTFRLFGSSSAQKQEKHLVLRVEYEYGRDWRYILKALKNLPGVKELSIKSVGTKNAQVTLIYGGASSMMNKSMVAQGLYVDASQDYWKVQLP